MTDLRHFREGCVDGSMGLGETRPQGEKAGGERKDLPDPGGKGDSGDVITKEKQGQFRF